MPYANLSHALPCVFIWNLPRPSLELSHTVCPSSEIATFLLSAERCGDLTDAYLNVIAQGLDFAVIGFHNDPRTTNEMTLMMCEWRCFLMLTI